MTDTEPRQEKNGNQKPGADGHFLLKVSPDKLNAYIIGRQAAAEGGAPVTADQIHKKLKNLNIKYGIDQAKIDALLAELNDCSEATDNTEQQRENNRQHCIATGKPPVHGQQAVLDWHINEEKACNTVVAPNELIATFHPATEGCPGTDIFGTPLRAEPGENNTIKPGDGIDQIKVDNQIEYRAKWYGTVRTNDDTLAVNCPLTIADDKMSAAIDLLPHHSKTHPIELDDVIKTLHDHNITFGIQNDVITNSLAALNETQQPIGKLVVAEGQPSVHSVNASIDWNIDYDETNKQDYIAHPGELIATRRLVTTGMPGKDIYGSEISVTPGEDTEIKISDNIIEDSDSHQYHSATLGIVIYKNNDNSIELGIDDGLKVTDSGMTARLSLYKTTSNGTLVTLADVIKTLESCGIKFGINEAAISEALNSAKNNSSPTLKEVIVAQGKPVLNGEDAYIVYSQKTNIAGEELSKGRIDFHERNYPWSFKKDDVIGRIIQAKPEKDGMDVRGEIIKAIPGNELELELEGAHIDGHNKIIADVDGTLIINGMHLSLSDILVINGDIAIETGNIHSTISVHIKGHVEPGYEVTSDKSIIIDKNIEDSKARAGGSITVKGGIRGLISEVYAPGDINADFIENANVFVNGTATITRSIINSKVSSNQSVTVGSKQAKHSAIIGGRITARTQIEAFVLGSRAFHKTIISVGFTQETKQQQRDLTREIDAKEKELIQLYQVETHCLLHPNAKTDEIISKVNATREATINAITPLKEQLSKIIQQLERSENIRVVVHNKVFPGVIIKINEHAYEVNREMSGGIFTLENDEIIFHPG
jgi:hypothetical protein